MQSCPGATYFALPPSSDWALRAERHWLPAVTPTTQVNPQRHQFLVRDRYFIAHRGAGDEAPEHTLAAYSRITDRGAEAISIAVHRTRDGILVCHQDPTLRRTSGQNIAIVDVTYDELSTHLVDLTRRVGPDWGLQPIPTFSEVLDRIGKRAVLFVESKNPEATADVIGALTAKQLVGTTVFTQPFTARESESIAREAGLAICTYVNSDAAGAEIDEAAERSDALGVLAGIPPTERGATHSAPERRGHRETGNRVVSEPTLPTRLPVEDRGSRIYVLIVELSSRPRRAEPARHIFHRANRSRRLGGQQFIVCGT